MAYLWPVDDVSAPVGTPGGLNGGLILVVGVVLVVGFILVVGSVLVVGTVPIVGTILTVRFVDGGGRGFIPRCFLVTILLTKLKYTIISSKILTVGGERSLVYCR